MKHPYLQTNAQVRRLFQSEEDVTGEWYEGNIYYMNPDWERNPFKSIKVVWLQQEKATDHWLYAYIQTDSG